MPGITVLDPTSEATPVARANAARLSSLDGVTVGLLNISKDRGDVFLDEIATELEKRGVATKDYLKPTFAKPAPADLRHKIATECGAVIEALAD